MRANAPVLGFRDREERVVTDSPFMRRTIDKGKLTLLVDHDAAAAAEAGEGVDAGGGDEDSGSAEEGL
ncbi:hypothetical protein [Nonomuraea recticatena]|uniref:hypothetical protein n=1 Tax=Nonomuraea recticatena TaxID=46178 RepID=UPI0031F864C6